MEGSFMDNSVLKVEMSFSLKKIRIFFTKLWTKDIYPNITTSILVHKYFFWEVTKEDNYLVWVTVILRYSSIIWNNFSVPTDLHNRTTLTFKMNAYWKFVLSPCAICLICVPPPLFPPLSLSLCIYIIIITYPGFILTESFRQQAVEKKKICIVFSVLINKIRLGIHRDSFFLTRIFA